MFTEVSKNRADYGVVPVENSTEGVVTHTLDMFVDSDLKIVSQIVLKVQQCLMSNSPRTQIKKLYVHPQSLAQCRGWIQNHLPRVEIIETSSNARSAELAAKEKGSAAIGGVLAAEKYDLEVLEQDIQDNAANATRFLVLGPAVQSAHRQRPHQPDGEHQPTRSARCTTPSRRSGVIASTSPRSNPAPASGRRGSISSSLIATATCRNARSPKPSSMLGNECSYVKVLGSYPNTE